MDVMECIIMFFFKYPYLWFGPGILFGTTAWIVEQYDCYDCLTLKDLLLGLFLGSSCGLIAALFGMLYWLIAAIDVIADNTDRIYICGRKQ